jgi:DNA polymerase/3'-5' exonuclease PolX
VGQRLGEKKFEPVIKLPWEQDEKKKVSILRRLRNISSDVHMKIIRDHNTDVIRKRLDQQLIELMSNKNANKKTCNIFKKKDEVITSNKHPIDEFIDDWWILNCPEHYSVTEINERVHNFFHLILLTNE